MSESWHIIQTAHDDFGCFASYTIVGTTPQIDYDTIDVNDGCPLHDNRPRPGWGPANTMSHTAGHVQQLGGDLVGAHDTPVMPSHERDPVPISEAEFGEFEPAIYEASWFIISAWVAMFLLFGAVAYFLIWG